MPRTDKKYRAVIFDLDGTLLDTLEDLRDSTNYALTQHGFPARTLDEVRDFVGNGAARLIERALPGGREAAAFDAVLACFRAHYQENCQCKTRPYPGVLALLGALQAHGLRLAVVSNKPHSAVTALCAAYFSGYLDAAIGEQPGVLRKPAPDGVRQALAALGCTAGETVYIGDSDVDIRTAANAEMDCISVSWGFRSEAFLRQHGATTVAAAPEALLRLLLPPARAEKALL